MNSLRSYPARVALAVLLIAALTSAVKVSRGLADPAEIQVSGRLTAISVTDKTITVGTIIVGYGPDTEFDGAGDPQGAADLKVGESVAVSATRRADGGLLAEEVTVVAGGHNQVVRLRGAIQQIAVTNLSLTVAGRIVAVDAHTRFAGAGAPASLADFKVGDFVVVLASKQADSTLLALSVRRLPAPTP